MFCICLCGICFLSWVSYPFIIFWERVLLTSYVCVLGALALNLVSRFFVTPHYGWQPTGDGALAGTSLSFFWNVFCPSLCVGSLGT